jgi:hypothetical protein
VNRNYELLLLALLVAIAALIVGGLIRKGKQS